MARDNLVGSMTFMGRMRCASLWVVALALGLLTMGNASADAPAHPAEPLGTFIRDWLLCGPFPATGSAPVSDLEHVPGFYTDHLAAHGGESDARIEKGQIETYEGGSAEWVRYRSKDDRIDLDTAVSSSDGVMAYAYCLVETERELASAVVPP